MVSIYEFLISRILALLPGLLVVAGLSAGLLAQSRAPAPTPFAPELEGLGSLSIRVSTTNPRAQRFFDQGLRLLYAFNHQEALRAFREAARLDAGLGMAYWGQAMAVSP